MVAMWRFFISASRLRLGLQFAAPAAGGEIRSERHKARRTPADASTLGLRGYF
jgi:hypothetical protein